VKQVLERTGLGRHSLWAVAVSMLGAWGDGSQAVQPGPPPPPPPPVITTVLEINVLPDSVAVPTGGSYQFIAEAHLSDGASAGVPMTWSATGGSVSDAGRFTAGLVAGKFRVISLDAVSGHADTSVVTIGQVPVPGGASVASVVVSPPFVGMFVGGQEQFTASALYSDGTVALIPLSWTATGGSISPAGVFQAGSVAGTFQVIATDSVSGKADTSVVGISHAPVPGSYLTLAARDWQAYPDKAALTGIGVEGGLQTRDPALPTTDFWDLVPDPLFGQVLRYNGGPLLNSTTPNLGGRVATYMVNLVQKTRPNSSWWTPPPGGSGSGINWFPTDLWVHQFIRFSPNWTTLSNTGGQGSSDYKAMFLRYWNSSARHEVKVGTNTRGMVHEGGNPGLTPVSEGLLPWNNAVSIDQQYGSTGWAGTDFWPHIFAPGPYPAAPYGSFGKYGLGNGEWVEVVVHHKTAGERGEFTVYWRQYTVAGLVAPEPWQIDARYFLAQPGEVFRGVSNYQMGVNRNRQYDEVMYLYWGPFEVVDGSQYPNPWTLPGG